MRKKAKKQRTRVQEKANLNLILWLTFSLFSLILIAMYAVAYNVIMNRRSREEITQNVKSACYRIVQRLDGSIGSLDQISAVMLSVTNEYGVGAYLFALDGSFVYPYEILESDAQIAQLVIDRMSGFSGEGKKAAVFSSKNNYAIAYSLEFGNTEYYLYISSSFTFMNELVSSMQWFSVIIALFAVALAFVVSGFVSMVITKPVCEVTEKAKELARGNYDVKFNGDYFCTEVADLAEVLNHSGEEISKADKMQKELIANVSHDFKTPLTMIKAYASMIREISGDDPEKRQKHTQIIIDEADRLAMLVGDLLDLSKMQAGIEDFERTVFNLSEDVYRVARRFGYLTDTQGYVIATEIDEDLYTYASRSRVEQVLYNLIGNAVNYTGEDKKIVIRLQKRADCSHFEVLDSGKGIAKEELDTIWERYYRSNESHKRPIKGTGLGLSIVKTILKKHNIRFGVQSELGKGSCFWVDFPIPPEDLSSRTSEKSKNEHKN